VEQEKIHKYFRLKEKKGEEISKTSIAMKTNEKF